MILIIDNYDSFTYNLVQRLGEIDASLPMRVVRNDQISVDQIESEIAPSRIIISPGPCTPNEAGISVECIQRMAGRTPILGVCLGHQAIGQAFGAKIVRAERVMHGKTDTIYHDQTGIFEDVENPFVATRYHSLIVQPQSVPPELLVSAWSVAPDGAREIMGLRHRNQPIFGVQFHPESFLTDAGHALLKRFLEVPLVA